jgi:(1->4)-alpha-D-glucan 1-alpha-D-glucosylmutase
VTRVHIPRATYRLQFSRDFTFALATEIVPYLAELGISHCYAPPFLKARPGSTHGYDIIDHSQLNPELGTPEDFDGFVKALHEHGMGQILDIVPNHMGIMGADNAWWLDVLENGEASEFAEFFDIDWQPLKDELKNKILVPILDDQYGAVLDRGELRLKFDTDKGEFSIFYGSNRFPVNPREYPRILKLVADLLGQTTLPTDDALPELQSITAGFGHLPARADVSPEQRMERARDKEIHKRRLAALCARASSIRDAIDHNVHQINGTPGDTDSFNDLHELIKAQAFRLAYWRVAADDINYRRFFDINDLAALRTENEKVFEATHRFILDLLRSGKVDGFRVDHPDGLYDPAQYFDRLQAGMSEQQRTSADELYVVVEKILTGDEQLPPEWPVQGTTGYDFMNLVNGLFVDSAAEMRMTNIYRNFSMRRRRFDDLVQRSKETVMHNSLASELNVLANVLSRIALADRHTCDFTLNSLRGAIARIVASFPVYRTYISERELSETDRLYIKQAVTSAKLSSRSLDTSVFDFIQGVLLAGHGDGRQTTFDRSTIAFAMKFQQFSSPVMAKGLEDTSFYRYNRLISLNDVGGDPQQFGLSVDTFHERNQQQANTWPHGLLATSTHDTKRSEDVRARINALSEIPALWRKKVRVWSELNRSHKTTITVAEAPSRNDEYLLYQTLLGVWPSRGNPEDGPKIRDRAKQYMLKAIREAKDVSSWANPNAAYEEAAMKFIDAVMDPAVSKQFLEDFATLQQFVARVGVLNSLSQTLIKLTAPGVPDVYQGTELFEFSLADPDNRRQVDYEHRRKMLAEMKRDSETQCVKAYAKSLSESTEDGRIKLYLIWKALGLRKQFPALFEKGSYLPLVTNGEHAHRCVAFARIHENRASITVVPRLAAEIIGLDSKPFGWGDTKIEIPELLQQRTFQNLFTSERISGLDHDQCCIAISELFKAFPVALLSNLAH